MKTGIGSGHEQLNPYRRPGKNLLLRLSIPSPNPSPASLPIQLPLTAKSPFKDLDPTRRLDNWSRSVHIFPAAYPRSLSGSSLAFLPPPRARTRGDGRSVAESLRADNLAAERVVPGTHKVIDEPQLFVAVARYYRDVEPQGAAFNHHRKPFTLIMAHGNGLHKETWEPTLAYLLLSPAGQAIEEIWSLDAVNHGDSAILNRQHLGTVVDWADNARDLLQFTLSYLPDGGDCSANLPRVLPRLECPNPSLLLLDEAPLSTSLLGHWRSRNLSLIGESFGGCAAALAATSLPELFNHVVLVEPVIEPVSTDHTERIMALASASASRRDTWKDATEAYEKLKPHPTFFGRWEDSALRRYVRYALDGSPLRLKCDKTHETSIFTNPHGRSADAYDRLLDYPLLPYHLILAAPNRSVIPEDVLQLHVSALSDCGRIFRVEGSGHAMVQERPSDLAAQIAWILDSSWSTKL